MAKSENTNGRPSTFSLFHRDQTDDQYYMTDMDWILYSYKEGDIHTDTFTNYQNDGRKVVFHAQFDEKNSKEANKSSIMSALNEPSVVFQSAVPWPFYVMFIYDSDFIIIPQNDLAKEQLYFIRNRLKSNTRFTYLPTFISKNTDAIHFTEPAMGNPGMIGVVWTKFEVVLRDYIFRHLSPGS